MKKYVVRIGSIGPCNGIRVPDDSKRVLQGVQVDVMHLESEHSCDKDKAIHIAVEKARSLVNDSTGLQVTLVVAEDIVSNFNIIGSQSKLEIIKL